MTHCEEELASMYSGMKGDLEAVLVFNILRTNSYLNLSIDATLREQRLTPAKYNALLTLRAAGPEGLLMGEIGERLVVTKSNVTGLVDRLESRGLVIRGEHPDRRATMVRLTTTGTELLDRIMPKLGGLLAELTECLSGEEKETLIRLLTKLRRELRSRRHGGR